MDSTKYGPELACIRTIEKRGAMDVVVAGKHLFFAGHGRLYVADVSEPAAPRLVGECPFRGAARQLTVRDGIAYVTARANGVFIFDVHDPARPELLCHYDCIELATGVEAQGDLLFIAQRQYGVEIVNVADPRHPVYVSKVKTHEAQSVDVRGRHIYVGDWGASELTTIDISDPYQPKTVDSHRLTGYGDGVCVAGDLLYASTGHHDRTRSTSPQSWRPSKDDPAYGAGHGLEVFSITNPAKPEFLGRTKFPRFYHRDGYDMWTPVAAGNGMVCCADTFNGIFLVDASNPREPRTVAHHPGLVAGVAVVDDIIYAACPRAGLKVLSGPGLVRRTQPDRGTPITVPPCPRQTPETYRTYRPGGQVWAVDFCGDRALVAAGMKGLRMVELWPEIREVWHTETQGFAVHVSVAGDRVYVSENTGGLSIWRHGGGDELQPLGRFEPRGGQAVRQATVYANGTRAVLQIGSEFVVLDVADPAEPKRIASHRAKIIYGDQVSHGDAGGRYACVWGHVTGIRWLDFEQSGEAINTGVNLSESYSIFGGVAALGEQFLCTSGGGYRLAVPLDTNLEAKPLYRFAKHFDGKPTVFGSHLFVASRVQSAVAVVDIADVQQPKLLSHFPTAGNPGAVAVHRGALVVPDGQNGLLVYDDFAKVLGRKR